MKKIINQMVFTTETKTIFTLIFFIIISRFGLSIFFTPTPNFSPIHAMALFCGAYFSQRFLSCLIVISTIWLSDIAMSHFLMGQWMLFYPGCEWQYFAYVLMTLLGSTLRHRIKPGALLITSLSSSILFFILSNFGVWMSGLLYPKTIEGLITCYLAAIPFYKNSLLADLFFSALILGGFEWIKQRKQAKLSLQP